MLCQKPQQHFFAGSPEPSLAPRGAQGMGRADPLPSGPGAEVPPLPLRETSKELLSPSFSLTDCLAPGTRFVRGKQLWKAPAPRTPDRAAAGPPPCLRPGVEEGAEGENLLRVPLLQHFFHPEEGAPRFPGDTGGLSPPSSLPCGRVPAALPGHSPGLKSTVPLR